MRLLHNPRRIVPTALNIAIRAARGDDHLPRRRAHALAPDYVRVGVETLQRTGADNVGGPMDARRRRLVRRRASRWRWRRASASASYFHFGTEEREVDTVYLGMWPRARLRARRALRRGAGAQPGRRVQLPAAQGRRARRAYAGDALAVPEPPEPDARWLRQYYQYGLWKVRVLQKHPRQMSWRHFVPPAFVAGAGGADACSARLVPLAGRSAARGVFGVYLLLVAGGGGAARAARRGVRAWLATALAFVSIHVALGSGISGRLGHASPTGGAARSRRRRGWNSAGDGRHAAAGGRSRGHSPRRSVGRTP